MGQNRTIELIDVLWLQKHSIVAAFEIESTTSTYSRLLRLSDLISMQPNLNIPLFIMCRFIAFATLSKRLSQMDEFVRYLKPEILDELAESCEIEEV